MGASFWVYARGSWRRLEVPSGRVGGWAGRVRFCFVRRGRVHLARAKAVLRGLRALQDDRPTTVRDGIPLSQLRRIRARAASPRCCCRAAADARNALVQLNLTALQPHAQPHAAPGKSDAAVQADSQPPGQPSGRKRALSPAPLPPAKLTKPESNSEAEPAPRYKELVVNEDDVAALRRFLERDPRLFAVDLHRFDVDDQYKSALFYKINPLVCAERDPRIAEMAKEEEPDERSLLRAFAGSLGLRCVSELRARRRYRMRPRRSSDKENAAANASPKLSTNKSSNSSRVLVASTTDSSDSTESSRVLVASTTDSSDSTESDSDFQTSSRVLRHKKRSHERNTRSKFAEIRSKYVKSKEERDDDVRAKYLVKPRHVPAKDDSTDSEIGEDSSRNNDRPKPTRNLSAKEDNRKDREANKTLKDKKRNETQVEIHHEPRERERNGLIKGSQNDSKERSPSKDKNERRSFRARDESSSPSIITKKLKTQRIEAATAKGSFGNSGTNSKIRNDVARDRRGKFLKKALPNRIDRKHSPSKSVDSSKDRKVRSQDRNTSKDREINEESSKDLLSSKTAKDQSKDKANSRSPSSKMKKKVNEQDRESENPWVTRNGTAEDKAGGSQGEDREGRKEKKRSRRSTANKESVFPAPRREYSPLEDHAIVSWVSLGSRAHRVNGNKLWRELQEQFARIAGRARSWHSLRNRYLRGILPALPRLALPPAKISALRAAQARGEIKSRRRAPVPNPLLSHPPVRSAWGARPRPDTHDTQDTLVPATSESETTQRSLRSSRVPSPRKHTPRPQPSAKPTSAKKTNRDQPSPTYSEVTRRFGAGNAASTPELRPRDTAPRDTAPRDTAPRDTAPSNTSPHKKTRKLFNPKTAV